MTFNILVCPENWSDHLFIKLLSLILWGLHKAGLHAIPCKIIPIPVGNYRDRILRFWRRNFLPWSEFLHAAASGGCKTRSCRQILTSSSFSAAHLAANCWNGLPCHGRAMATKAKIGFWLFKNYTNQIIWLFWSIAQVICWGVKTQDEVIWQLVICSCGCKRVHEAAPIGHVAAMRPIKQSGSCSNCSSPIKI